MSSFDGIRDALFGTTTSNACGVQLAEMEDAQQGALYFLAKTGITPYPKQLSVASSVLSGVFGNTVFLEDISTLSSAIVTRTPVIGTSFGQALSRAGSLMGYWVRKLDTDISAFFIKILNKLASLFGRFSATVREQLHALSPSVLGALAGEIVSHIPGWSTVNSASTIYQGTRQAISGTFTLFSQMWSSHDVELLGGHPSIIANALARHSLAKAALGTRDVVVEATKMGLETAGGMLGTVTSILSTVLQSVVSFVEGMVQKYFVKKTLKEAAEYWKIRTSSHPMPVSHQKFSEWFQIAVIPCPIIAAITLNSGFVAHPYRFLKLIDANNQLKSAGDFAKGAKHIEKLKDISKNYIHEYVNEYEMRFSGKDPLVSARLNDVILGKAFPSPPPMFTNNTVKVENVQTKSHESDLNVMEV